MSLAISWFVGISLLSAQERPLTELPYTPALDQQFMDRTADPCVDFYRYACGNWNKLNPIPADQARWNVYSKMQDENSRFLWGLLEQLAQTSAERNANQQKIGDYFEACMDEAAVEKAGATPLEKRMQEIAAVRTPEQFAALVARL